MARELLGRSPAVGLSSGRRAQTREAAGSMKTSLFFAPIVVLLVLSGCNLGQGPIVDPVVGTWNLTSETSNGVPVTPVPNVVLTMNEYGYSLDLDGFWSEVNNTTSTNSSGTWSRVGSTYPFLQAAPSASFFTGTISGNTLTVTDATPGNTIVQVFLRQ